MSQIPVFYINLGRRPDRRAFMEEQFDRLGIVAERIEAVGSDEVTDAHMAPHLDRDNPWSISRVEVACRLSHERVWHLMQDRALDSALILEDDVILGAVVPRLLDSALMDELGASLLRLEASDRPVRLGRALATLQGRFAVRRLLTSSSYTGAYIIKTNVARMYLEDPRLAKHSIDGYLFMRRGPVVPGPGMMQLDPAPCIQLAYDALSSGPEKSSDLHEDRLLGYAGRHRSVRTRWRQFVADSSYSMRSGWATLLDSGMSVRSRQRVAFDRMP
jgi:GR25 family glycosyltransferase involved in LPS biosynthesis